jgi:hypothetical protein
MIDIGTVANTTVEMTGLMNCDIDTAWKRYLHPAVKEGHSLEEVKAYIEKKIEQGKTALDAPASEREI